MKKLSILGSSGSIGTQTLDIARRYPDKFEIIGLSVNGSLDVLKEQVKEFHPQAVSVGTQEMADKLFKEVDIPVYFGMEGLVKIATMPDADTVVTSVVGSVGLKPTVEAIRAGKNIALANKETLVTAGDIVMAEAKKAGVKIIPVDSEHCAIFQSLNGGTKDEVRKIIITCSGGPFKGKKKEDLGGMTAKEALNHPTWNMGGKITIDSSTLMNKGLEVIEAHHLFGMSYENIEVIIHPQSIIHSMVEYIDGSILAQLATHDMRLPILYALSYPERFDLDLPTVNFAQLGQMTFLEPDLETFECLALALEAGKRGGTLPCVMNAANEIAVDFFLNGKIKFLDIQNTVKKMMQEHEVVDNPDLDQILKLDEEIKGKTREYLESILEA